MDLRELTIETFEPRVGDVFALDAPQPVELVLHAVVALGPWPGGRQPFSLTFRGPDEPRLAQATYRLEHPELGALEIFIVPVGHDGDGLSYEAIFT
jgi:hypothetical protein